MEHQQNRVERLESEVEKLKSTLEVQGFTLELLQKQILAFATTIYEGLKEQPNLEHVEENERRY